MAKAQILYFMQVQASRYMERRLVKNAMNTLRSQLDNSLTSEEHKLEILKLMEETERLVAFAEVQRIKHLGQLQFGDVSGANPQSVTGRRSKSG